jgi:hypothetical protein
MVTSSHMLVLPQGNLACWTMDEEGPMAKLTASKKNSEPNKDFGLPEQRKYPMPDASHARNAKARASQMEKQGKLSAADKRKVDAKADRVLGK